MKILRISNAIINADHIATIAYKAPQPPNPAVLTITLTFGNPIHLNVHKDTLDSIAAVLSAQDFDYQIQ